MKQNTSPKGIKGVFRRLQIFHIARPLLSWGIIGGILVVFLVAFSGFGYVAYNYTQLNPKFCITCHDIMIESYETWQVNEHAELNCHSCHYFTPEYAINFPLSAMKSMPAKIPDRPKDKIVVPDKYCMSCHWDGKKQHGDAGEWAYWIFPKPHISEDANKVTDSRFHALHYFMGPTACVTCHGQKRLHVATSEPDDCFDCHQDKAEAIHTADMADLACFNCHTDQTADLNPNQEKCLSCHSEDTAIWQQLADAGTIDVKYAPPADDMIASAPKIAMPPEAPMAQLNCSSCHSAHPAEDAAVVTAKDSCISCHTQIMTTGQHTRHAPYYQNNCLSCHKEHGWSIDEEWAQQECAKCHPYKSPASFVSSGEEI